MKRLGVLALLCVSATVHGQTELLETYAQALRGNSSYQSALADFRAVQQGEALAKGKLLPQVSARVRQDWIDESISGDYYGIRNIDREDDYSVAILGVTLTQALYRPELPLGVDQAELRVEQARATLKAREGLLMLAVAETYFAVLAAQDNLRLATAEKEAVQRQYEQVHGRFGAGLATEADDKEAEAQPRLAEANVLDAEGGLEAAYNNLELVTGKSYRNLKVLPEGVTLSLPEPADVEAWVERARQQNHSVVARQMQNEVARLEYEKARKLHWPKLDLVGGAFRLDSGGGLAGDREEDEQRIGLDFSLPLFTGGQLTALVGQAEEGKAKALAELRDEAGRAARDARVFFFNCQIGLQRVQALKGAVDATRVSESAAQAGFEVGTRTSAEMQRIVEQRFEAERDYAAARYRYVINQLQLKQAAGALSAADLSRIDRLLRLPAGQ